MQPLCPWTQHAAERKSTDSTDSPLQIAAFSFVTACIVRELFQLWPSFWTNRPPSNLSFLVHYPYSPTSLIPGFLYSSRKLTVSHRFASVSTLKPTVNWFTRASEDFDLFHAAFSFFRPSQLLSLAWSSWFSRLASASHLSFSYCVCVQLIASLCDFWSSFHR